MIKTSLPPRRDEDAPFPTGMRRRPCAPGFIAAAFVGMILSSGTRCYSAAITLSNPSFELPDAADGSGLATVPGWTIDLSQGPGGVFDASDFQYPNATGNVAPLPGTADGFQFLATPSSSFAFQVIGPLARNTLYTLTVAFGDSLNPGNSTGWIQLVNGNNASGTLLAENRGFSGVEGTFVDRSVSFTTGNSVSGNLTIVLRNDPLGADYDNVRLDATPVPEPTLGMLAVGGMAALLSPWRRRDRFVERLPGERI